MRLQRAHAAAVAYPVGARQCLRGCEARAFSSAWLSALLTAWSLHRRGRCNNKYARLWL